MKLFTTYQTMFNNFDQTVRSYLSKTLNNLGLQYSHSQIFGVIFDGIKGIMQNMLFYIEDALTEQNIFTATRRKSIYSLAKVSGYTPYYGSAAQGTIIARLQINNGLESQTTKLYIKNNTKIINKNTNITYLIDLPTDYYVVDVSKPLINHEFKIIQGYFDRAQFVAKGYALENFEITTVDLFDKEYIKLKVNGVEWKQVPSLYDMTENGNEYVCELSYDEKINIMFGNGIYGSKLNNGDVVVIEYLKHSGIMGNVLSDEITDFKFADYGQDVYGNGVDINNYLKIDMVNCISGGNNSDSIEFIRNMIGKNSRSLVLASKDNFELFFKRFSFIGNVNCWAENNSMFIVASCTRNINSELKTPEDYFKINTNNLFLKKTEKEMIQNTLENSKRAFAGVSLKFEDPIIRKFAIICYVKIENTYQKHIVETAIKRYLAEYFLKRLINTQFIAKSDIIKYLLDNIPEIKSLNISIFSGMAEDAYKDSYYYKYVFKNVNGTYEYDKKKIIYEKNSTPGLDTFENISLDSKIEMPILSNITYYQDKDNNSKNSITMDAVQVYFA